MKTINTLLISGPFSSKFFIILMVIGFVSTCDAQNANSEVNFPNDNVDNVSLKLDNEQDCEGLLKTVKEGNITKLVNLLKTTNPNCSITGNEEPRTPLVSAAREGFLEIGKLLVEAKADIEFHAPKDESPLMAASKNGHLEFVKFLISEGAEINVNLDEDGTALLLAAKHGHLEIVKYLISQGAETNAQVERYGTPLICSVRSGNLEITKILLENGADPNLGSKKDENPMYHALQSKNQSMISLLKESTTKN